MWLMFHPKFEDQLNVVNQTLIEIGAGDKEHDFSL
jgi:hypothetical protein